MLDHLLPLIYCEYEYLDESNKENYGYVIRRRARPVSSTISTPSRTPPRPPRRSISPSSRMEGGVASCRSIKRRRETSDDGSEDRGHAKKQQTMETAVKKEEPASRRSLKRRRDATDDGSDERGDVKKQRTKDEEEKSEEKQEQEEETELVTPVKKPQEPKISAKKVAKKIKTIKKKKKQTKVKDAKKIVKVSKTATPKRIPLQDITHLYVNEHVRLYEYQQRARFVAGLTTSVAIPFF